VTRKHSFELEIEGAMSHAQAFLKSIEAIYDAGTDAGRWPDALGLINGLVKARFCDLVVMRRNRIMIETSSRPEPEFLMRNLDEDSLRENLWLRRQYLDPGNKTIVGEQLASPAEIKQTRFYADYLKVLDLFHMCGVKLWNKSDLLCYVGAGRSERQRQFGNHEVDLMDSIAPHVSRATRIAALLRDVDLYATTLESASNQLAFGLLLVDETGRALFANSEAERLLRNGRILHQRNGRLTCTTGTAHQRLTAFLNRLALLPEAAALYLTDADGHSMKLIGAPLPERRRDFACLSATARSVVFLFDLSTSAPPPMQLIAELYGLTPAECRLAEALLAGETLTEYGERVGLSRNTLKTELKSVFSKMGSMRQSNLVRQLAKLAAVTVVRP
jgi:DNA-binding CsgD family transcriptional regulator